MNPYAFGSNGDIGLPGIDPPARVVVLDPVLLLLQGLVCVSAKNAFRSSRLGVQQRTGSHFRRHPQPACVEAVYEAGDWLALEIELLQLEIDYGPEMVQPEIVHHKAVELMSVNGKMLQAGDF